MAVLVILFVWLPYSWNKIVISILGVLLALLALSGTCCCTAMKEAKAKETGAAEIKETKPAEAKE